MLNKPIAVAFTGLAPPKIDAKDVLIEKSPKLSAKKLKKIEKLVAIRNAANAANRTPSKKVVEMFKDFQANSMLYSGCRIGDTDWERPEWADDELLRIGREATEKYFGT